MFAATMAVVAAAVDPAAPHLGRQQGGSVFPGAQPGEAASQLMFKDEHMVTFHRRLAWSPDGERLTT